MKDITRRTFLKGSAIVTMKKGLAMFIIAVLLSASFLSPINAEGTPGVTVNAADFPQALFAKEQIETAVEKLSVSETWIINIKDIDTALGQEAYQIKASDHTITVTGGDETGLMYGGFQVAEEMELYGLESIKNEEGRPSMEYRGIKFNAPLDMCTPSYSDAGDVAQANIKNMWDMDFWKEYLDFLALNRYNAFSLWNLNPFPSMVKVPEYPVVALNDVWHTTLPFDDSYNTANHCQPYIQYKTRHDYCTTSFLSSTA